MSSTGCARGKTGSAPAYHGYASNASAEAGPKVGDHRAAEPAVDRGLVGDDDDLPDSGPGQLVELVADDGLAGRALEQALGPAAHARGGAAGQDGAGDAEIHAGASLVGRELVARAVVQRGAGEAGCSP